MKLFVYFAFTVLLLGLSSCKKTETPTTSTTVETSEDPSAQMNPIQKELYLSGFEVFKGELQAPDFTVYNLKDQPVALSGQKGKVVLINLWATWCPPCRKEMPSIEKLYKAYKGKDLVIMAISSGEDKKTVTDFLKTNPYSFPIYIDGQNSATQNYSTGSIPSTYLINKKGQAVARLVGAYEWDNPDFMKIINQLLAE